MGATTKQYVSTLFLPARRFVRSIVETDITDGASLGVHLLPLQLWPQVTLALEATACVFGFSPIF
jgi:hypothetical protein